MRIVSRAEIEQCIDPVAIVQAVADGFAAFSRGEVTLAPVGHLDFKQPPGEVHIKSGFRHGDTVYVVKIASGFYENPRLGLSSGDGLMLVFSSRTGHLQTVLLDEGLLTDLRTAAAGAVAAKYLAPKRVRTIGILGAGVQARLQLDYLRHVTDCRQAIVWARDAKKAAAFNVPGFAIKVARSAEELVRACQLIVTTTPARGPLFDAAAVQPGTHITAMGSDSPGKQELDPQLLARAEVLVVDSLRQCLEQGELQHAIKLQPALRERCVELGNVVLDPRRGRTNDEQISVADLTGLAIQDIEIAKLVSARAAATGLEAAR